MSVVIIFEPATLDPATNYDVGGEAILSNCYETLVRAVGTKKVKIVPDLATSWTKSPNGKVWTFHLRKGVKFVDGTTLNANDVVATYAQQWDVNNALHKGRQNLWTYFGSLFGACLNGKDGDCAKK